MLAQLHNTVHTCSDRVHGLFLSSVDLLQFQEQFCMFSLNGPQVTKDHSWIFLQIHISGDSATSKFKAECMHFDNPLNLTEKHIGAQLPLERDSCSLQCC